MEKIHGNMHVFVLTCKFFTCKHKNIHVSMSFRIKVYSIACVIVIKHCC